MVTPAPLTPPTTVTVTLTFELVSVDAGGRYLLRDKLTGALYALTPFEDKDKEKKNEG